MAKNPPKTKAHVNPLPMPMASAVWLFDNTTWTFDQIAAFTDLPLMSVEAIANGQMGVGINGRNPVEFGETTQSDIDRAQKDPTYIPPRLARATLPASVGGRNKGSRYTPLSKRGDKPDAIAWIVRNHSQVSDAQIVRLIGTTKNTINAVRNRTHANIQNIRPQHPVDLGLCTWADLEATLAKAGANKSQTEDSEGGDEGQGGTKDTVSGFDFAHFMPVRQGTQN